jgi:predicted ester cyclase
MRRAFPDLHYQIEDIIATDDTVVMRVKMTGTHRGELFGLPATGRRVSVEQININVSDTVVSSNIGELQTNSP